MQTAQLAYEETAPSEVRRLVLEEHNRVRQTLAIADAYAEATLAGDPSVGASLREAVRDLARALACHITTEDMLLAPLVLHIDAWGPVRVEQLACDHAKQSEALDLLASGAFVDSHELAWVVRRVAAEVQSALCQEEEAGLLHPDLLRDDLVSIDQLGG